MWYAIPVIAHVSPSCRDLQTILSDVGEIGELITTIEVLAMETEVGVSSM